MKRRGRALVVPFITGPTYAGGDLRPRRKDRGVACGDAARRPVLVLPLGAAYAASRQVRHRGEDATRRRPVTRAKPYQRPSPRGDAATRLGREPYGVPTRARARRDDP